MSRYFTSPPPVYARNWANGQNLVDSTKIERLQVVSSKKLQRKEKKERKKDKKHKSEKSSSLKLKFVQTKQVCDETEQIEKSCVTEELEQQQSVGYLSDGSQNSKKRRRENSPAVESQIKATSVAGKPLKIRFVFKKPKEAEVVPQEELVCSTKGTEQRPFEVPESVLATKTLDRNENLPSTSYESEKALIPSQSKKTKKHKPSKESRFNTLFDEWVPPCISSFAARLKEVDSNNDDWLFGSSRQGKAMDVRNDEELNMSLKKRSGDSSLPSRAQFLPEVGIFSLPYTVLF